MPSAEQRAELGDGRAGRALPGVRDYGRPWEGSGTGRDRGE